MAALFNAFVSFESVLPVMIADRAAFFRERASQTYNAFWYFVGSTIVEIPYSFVSGLFFTVVFYPLVGFTGFTTAVVGFAFNGPSTVRTLSGGWDKFAEDSATIGRHVHRLGQGADR